MLSNHNGTAQDDFGIPGDTTCLGVTRFAPGACRQLKESTPPYLGTFRPDGDVEAWRPDTLNGNYWKLVFFDRALKDIGILRYANIEFSTQKCLTPLNFVLTGADANELSVSWDVPAASCNTVRLGLTKPDGTIQEVFVECSEKQYTFFGLETEGLQTMKEGGKTRSFIPSHLAYGKRGAGLDIGPDETLIFEVELLKVWED